MRNLWIVAVALVVAVGVSARADDDVIEQRLVLKDHAFVPHELTIPQGRKIKLIVDNQDPTAAEFESAELHREKVVAAKSTTAVFIGPLDPGAYGFFDDFHRDSTTGTLIVK